MDFKLNHVGWITNDIEAFEKFWCNIMGFELISESELPSEMCQKLFDSAGPAPVRKYSKAGWDSDIEIHQFPHRYPIMTSGWSCFDADGMNHICIHTGGSGSRQSFLDELPKDIQTHIYDNPKGWQNIFVRDYEGNWIELRENL